MSCVSEFSETLEWWLERRDNLTPTAIARQCGLDKTAVRQLIVNGRTPKVDTAQKICAALGVSLDQFFAKDDDGRRRRIARLLDQLHDDEIELLQAAAQGLIEHRREAK